MKHIVNTDNGTLHLSDDPNDPVVLKFIDNVVNDALNNKLKSLIRSGLTKPELLALQKTFSVVWLFDGEPLYGFFITQYPELPSNVARTYVRVYNINRIERSRSLSFFRKEHETYATHLKPLLLSRGIDTLFFTRHATDTNNEFLYTPKKNKPIYGYREILPFRNIKFKGFDQHIYCFSPWIDNPPKTEFIALLPTVK